MGNAARDPGTVTAEEAAHLRAGSGPFYADFLAALVERRVQARDAAARAESGGARGYDYRDYRRAHDAMLPHISKALAVAHVPFLALALMLLFRPSRRYYAEHFVVTLHLVAFYMAPILILGYGAELIWLVVPHAEWQNSLLNWTIRAVLTIYIVMALHRTYAASWGRSIAGTLGLFAAYLLFNLCVYRPALFLTVFAVM